MKKHHRHENDCLNCGTELQGHFCHVCGQENLHLKEPFWHFLSHSISHYFHFDEKFFSTLKPLLTNPGYLTQQYLDGKRTRFLHPVSMYIFVSIVYFLVIPGIHPKAEKTNTSEPVVVNSKLPATSTSTDNAAMQKHQQNVSPKATVKADSDSGSIGQKITNNIVSQPIINQALVIDSLNKVYSQHPTDGLKRQIDSLKEDIDSDDNLNKVITETKHPGIFRKMLDIGKAIKKPEFKKEFEHYQPKLYFLLMPLFAFFLMLNFGKNHKYYVEHIVFTIHFFTAFFIFEIVVQPINHFIFNGSWLIGTLRVIAILWYSYRALRVFYERPRWLTIRKMFTLGIFLSIAFSISYLVIGSIVYMITQ